MKLSDLFPLEDVHVKVQSTTKDKKGGLIVCYLDARDIMDRLDDCEVVWTDTYRIVSQTPSVVECSLTVDGVTKTDVGEGDAFKDAYSDALKRAAVKFGIGRYLYRSEQVWTDLDDRGRMKNEDVVKRKMLGKFYPSNGQGAPKKKRPAAPPVTMTAPVPEPLSTPNLGGLHALGKPLYGEFWDTVRHLLVQLVTSGRTDSSKDLSQEEVNAACKWLAKILDQGKDPATAWKWLENEAGKFTPAA